MLDMIPDQLVSDGGPSAPAWAFFTAITLGILAILGEQLKARRAAIEAKEVAKIAAKNSENAATNTRKVGNGFTDRIEQKLDEIVRNQDALEQKFTQHVQWHLEKGTTNVREPSQHQQQRDAEQDDRSEPQRDAEQDDRSEPQRQGRDPNVR